MLAGINESLFSRTVTGFGCKPVNKLRIVVFDELPWFSHPPVMDANWEMHSCNFFNLSISGENCVHLGHIMRQK